MTNVKLIVICGATATGKSKLALDVASQLQTAIISADSRQVYREFDIGTAKPTLQQRQQVPHYGIDICDPTETMTVAAYQEYANHLVEEFSQKGSPQNPWPLLLVGGTGLYIKAVVRGMKIPRVPPHPTLRSQLSALGQPLCHAMLQQVDPTAASKIHANDSVRTLRALEVFYVTGIPISQQQGENPPDYPILQIGIDCDGSILASRIAHRSDRMIAQGLVSEVEYLCQKYGRDLPLLDTLGYGEMKQYLAGEIDLQAARELTIEHTRQFAKRQRTWFRAVPEIEWFSCDDPNLYQCVWQRIETFLQADFATNQVN